MKFRKGINEVRLDFKDGTTFSRFGWVDGSPRNFTFSIGKKLLHYSYFEISTVGSGLTFIIRLFSFESNFKYHEGKRKLQFLKHPYFKKYGDRFEYFIKT